MPRPTSILDYAALGMAMDADAERPLWHWSKAPPRHGAVRFVRLRRAPKVTWIAVVVCGLLLFGTLIVALSRSLLGALSHEVERAFASHVLTIGFIGWAAYSIPHYLIFRVALADYRAAGAARYLRIAPVLRLRSALATDAPRQFALTEFVQDLLATRQRTQPRRSHTYYIRPTFERLFHAAMTIPLTIVLLSFFGGGLHFTSLNAWLYSWVTWTVALPVVLLAVLKDRRGAQAQRRHQSRECANCGFHLRGVPVDAILKAADATLAHRIGPPKCPECGVHWPLVPPPTPDEVINGNRVQRPRQLTENRTVSPEPLSL